MIAPNPRVAVLTDRSVVSAGEAMTVKRKFRGPIAPDEVIADSGLAVNRAVDWIVGP